MITIDEIKKILAKNKDELAGKYNVQDIGVFGSYVRGEQVKGSDLDVLVTFREPIGLFKFLGLEYRLEELLGVKVDLVSKNALKPRIGERILREVVYVQ
jgi:predicted nucleotidyltransferase